MPPPSLAPPPAPQPATPASIRLPIVFDRRVADASLGLGDSVDAVSLDAGYRIAGLTPADLDSSAGSLATVLDDTYGFTLSSVPAGWVAEFGFYTPHLRQVDVIPTQVRDLRSLFAAFGEGHVAWAWLMAGVPGQGDTYLPR